MIIGLIGSTNTGKSTLFNRLIKQHRAIVTDISGTTTDIIQVNSNIEGIGNIDFLDSPGLDKFSEEIPYIKNIIIKSDLIFFIIDDSIGISAKENEIKKIIINNNKKKQTLLLINKLDKTQKEQNYQLACNDYYNLGFDNIIGISAKNGTNINQIINFTKQFIKKNNIKISKTQTKDFVPLAIIGKPNAGKSTLLNTLVGQDISKVEDKAGTTRDYIDGEFTINNQNYKIFDTAGIRKKGKILGLEKIAYQKTFNMLKYVKPITIFMIDATEGLTHRDTTIIQEIVNIQLPIILCLNKIDLIKPQIKEKIIKQTSIELNFAKYIPILTINSTTPKGKNNLFKIIQEINSENNKRIDTNKLNNIIKEEITTRPPRFPKNKVCKIKYITQIFTNPIIFKVFVNKTNRVNFAFKKWIENSIRKHYKFIGVPIKLEFKENDSYQTKG